MHLLDVGFGCGLLEQMQGSRYAIGAGCRDVGAATEEGVQLLMRGCRNTTAGADAGCGNEGAATTQVPFGLQIEPEHESGMLVAKAITGWMEEVLQWFI